jgi:hypothetical protein
MCNQLILTRYLYAKNEVELALLVAILNKKVSSALFWAYELYYSGFINELKQLLFKIYIDFFATQNDDTIIKLCSQIDTDEKQLGIAIQMFILSNFNCDVFYLRQITSLFENDYDYDTNDSIEIIISKLIISNDYRSIANWILNMNKSVDNLTILKIFIDKCKMNKLSKSIKLYKYMLTLGLDSNLCLLVQVLKMIPSNIVAKPFNFTLTFTDEQLTKYKTEPNVSHYKILKNANLISINELGMLHLFKLKRDNYDLRDCYLNNWLFHASFSPLWKQRIEQFDGLIDNELKTITFDDDKLEAFYNLYGLEPDEQPKEIQDKSISNINNNAKVNWKSFDTKFKKNSLFNIYDEELEEFDTEPILY